MLQFQQSAIYGSQGSPRSHWTECFTAVRNIQGQCPSCANRSKTPLQIPSYCLSNVAAVQSYNGIFEYKKGLEDSRQYLDSIYQPCVLLPHLQRLSQRPSSIQSLIDPRLVNMNGDHEVFLKSERVGEGLLFVMQCIPITYLLVFSTSAATASIFKLCLGSLTLAYFQEVAMRAVGRKE